LAEKSEFTELLKILERKTLFLFNAVFFQPGSDRIFVMVLCKVLIKTFLLISGRTVFADF